MFNVSCGSSPNGTLTLKILFEQRSHVLSCLFFKLLPTLAPIDVPNPITYHISTFESPGPGLAQSPTPTTVRRPCLAAVGRASR